MGHVAIVNKELILQGFDVIKQDVPENVLFGEHVGVPEGCDLKPGEYVWSIEKSAWLPMRKLQTDPLGLTIRAIILGLQAVRDQSDIQLPDETLQFIEIWERSGQLDLWNKEHKGAVPQPKE